MEEKVEIIKVDKISHKEDFKNLLKILLKEIYGDEKRGFEIYEKRYGAISFYLKYKARKNSFLIVAYSGQKLIGFLFAKVRKKDSYIYDIVVDPKFRKKGVGRKLVKFFLEKAKFPLFVDAQKEAVEFFKKLGFKEVRKYESDGVLWYRLKLN